MPPGYGSVLGAGGRLGAAGVGAGRRPGGLRLLRQALAGEGEAASLPPRFHDKENVRRPRPALRLDSRPSLRQRSLPAAPSRCAARRAAMAARRTRPAGDAPAPHRLVPHRGRRAKDGSAQSVVSAALFLLFLLFLFRKGLEPLLPRAPRIRGRHVPRRPASLLASPGTTGTSGTRRFLRGLERAVQHARADHAERLTPRPATRRRSGHATAIRGSGPPTRHGPLPGAETSSRGGA